MQPTKPLRLTFYTALMETNTKEVPVRRGKVRDIYDLGDRLLIVATDRISAFDVVLPNGIPDKGRVLTGLSNFWFDFLAVPHHVISYRVKVPIPEHNTRLFGRTMLVKKAKVVPFECVVRGYLAGSGWKDYCRDQAICGIQLPKGMKESQQLEEPIFTPATKAAEGHDMNVSLDEMAKAIGRDAATWLRGKSIELYKKAAEHAKQRGIIIADTKFEWGWHEGQFILIDEALTPDSSRFWPADQYKPGRSQLSFDKQYVRDWLEAATWNKQPPAPSLPSDVIANTRAKYIQAYEQLTGKQFAWR